MIQEKFVTKAFFVFFSFVFVVVVERRQKNSTLTRFPGGQDTHCNGSFMLVPI